MADAILAFMWEFLVQLCSVVIVKDVRIIATFLINVKDTSQKLIFIIIYLKYNSQICFSWSPNWIWVLYKIVKIYFAQVKLYPLFQNWKGGDAGRFSAASMVLPSRTQLESREGKGGYPSLMVGIFFFFNVSCTRASEWVSLLVDCLSRYHTPSREVLRSLTRTGVRSVRVELH